MSTLFRNLRSKKPTGLSDNMVSPRRSKLSQRVEPSATDSSWQVHILKRSSARAISSAAFRKVAVGLLGEIQRTHRTRLARNLSVLLTGDVEIHQLNLHYRGKDKPTDVLSYAAGDNSFPDPDPTLGDLVISFETARKQAKEYGVTVERELLRLLIHGILHLIGYDHEKVPRADAQRMRRKENELYLMFEGKVSGLVVKVPRSAAAGRRKKNS